MGEHVVDRGTAALNGRVIVPGYYIVAAFISLMPWIAWLPQIWSKLRTEWNREAAFLVSWFLAPQIIFFLYATQLPHYTMPGFAAFFILLGSVLSGKSSVGVFGGIYLAFINILGVFILAVGARGLGAPTSGLGPVLIAVGALFVAISFVGVASALNQKAFMAVALLFVAMSVGKIGQAIRAIHPVVAMQSVIKGSKEQGEAVAWQFTEPSLVFYGERPFKMLSKIKQIEDRMRKGKTDVIVCEKREWTLNHAIQQWRKGEAQTTDKDFSADVERLSTLATQYEAHDFAGFNLARASWVEIRVWKHKAKAP
jgi:hypothetical protein